MFKDQLGKMQSSVQVIPRLIKVTSELIIPLGEINLTAKGHQKDAGDGEELKVMNCDLTKAQNFEHLVTCTALALVLIKPNVKLILKPVAVEEEVENVKVLELSHQLVHFLPINLGSLFGNLTRLYASCCHLKELQRGNFTGLKNLEFMSLWMNKLEAIPDNVFDDLINLKSLNLQANNIRRLPEYVFEKLTKLQNINLSRNHLRFIPADLFQFNINLEHISLNDNYVTYVSPRLLSTLKKLKTATFLRNPAINEEAIRQRDIVQLKAFIKMKFRDL